MAEDERYDLEGDPFGPGAAWRRCAGAEWAVTRFFRSEGQFAAAQL